MSWQRPELVLWIIGCAWMLIQQIRVRRLVSAAGLSLLGFLLVLGVATVIFGVAATQQSGRLSAAAVAVMASTLPVAVLAGWLRSRTVKVWRSGSTLLRQGGIATVGLWVAWVAAHAGLDLWANRLSHGVLGSSTLWLAMFVSLVTQLALLTRRSRALPRVPDRVPSIV
ncbi:hypothetical protein [Microlunatus sp. Gsoil 973]|jgi:hypothetical protein|uniref:hypothetical protein n=1 Tax=Microlunatus sp. Gsoil 973 TaxID=2672569 RepID=UPI0012B4A162|nr:hypothetical protein [Microlunatus sp. Gsoil 973]QGN32234.1 hypothetical protein GJV80_04860 [Microlunatus sp. Gsoil 973]